MKTTIAALILLFTITVSRGSVLFSDDFNYPDGCVETDGVWYCYTPATPHQDAFVTNNLLILDQKNYDGVAAPFVNNTGSTILYASFNINVSSLPTSKGGYFCNFKDNTNDYVCHVFIATTNTVVPGTYRLGVDNFSTSSSQAFWFPLDLATGITYQVVFSYDTDNSDPLAGATLAVNPGSESDFDSSTAYAIDTTTNEALQAISISQIALSQYTGQGVASIGNVLVGTSYSEVVTNTALPPVIGIAPQGASVYSGDDVTLYVAASGTGQLGYQWLGNGQPLSGDGNVLALTDLQSSINVKVIVSNSAGSVTSDVAVVSVDSTLTPPFFTLAPQGQTNTLGSAIQLSASALGTGPLTYQWYFEPTNALSFSQVATGPTLSLTNVTFTQAGLYYVQVTGGDGSTNSPVVTIAVLPPPLVSIAYLHALIATNSAPTSVFNVQGVVTSFAPLSATGKTYAEYYIQDATAGIYVYVAGQGSNNVPPAGALVSVTGPIQLYYGQLEIDPNITSSAASNSVSVLSYNNPLPQSAPLDLLGMASNPTGAYGNQIQCSLVTLTNVYIYSSASGAPVSGTFPTNANTTLYAFTQPYSAGQTNLIIYVYGSAGEATNFWGQPIPNYACEITGIMGLYSTTEPELYPTRYIDFVTALPAPFSIRLTRSNSTSQVSWPAVAGSTYSVYAATNAAGPWVRSFGLSYFPSSGTFAETNAASRRFYRVGSP